MEEQISQAERDLRTTQTREKRAITLFVSGKITEAQLDNQRTFITERLESARAKLDDYLAQEASGAEKRRLMEEVLTWVRDFGQGLDELTPEERHDYLQMIVEQVVIDRDNNVDITLAIPIDDNSPEPGSPEPECVSIGSQEPSQPRSPQPWGRSGSGPRRCLRPPDRACRRLRSAAARSAGTCCQRTQAFASPAPGPAWPAARRRTAPSTPEPGCC